MKQNDGGEFLIHDLDDVERHWAAKWIRWATSLDFLVSLNLHLLLLLAAAVFLLPHSNPLSIKLEGSQSATPVEFDTIEVSIEVPELDHEWEPEQFEYLEEDTPEEMASMLARPVEFSATEFALPAFESLTQGVVEFASNASGEKNAGPPPEAEVIQEKVVEAGGKSGEVQFSLVWESKSDLDLHVINPAGDRIFYKSRFDRLGGALDVDCNADHRRLSASPVENVRWLQGDPASGRYTVWVHFFRARNEDSADFKMMAKTGGDFDIQEAQVSRVNSLLVFRYFYFGNEVPEGDRADRLDELKKLQEREEEAAAKLLRAAGRGRQARQQLLAIAATYPHTDAALEALKRVEGTTRK